MPWATGVWARQAFAGRVSTAPPPGQYTLPPPIPGGTATWVFEKSQPLAFGIRGWAGRVSPTNYPGGGISIRPVPERGVMQITGWWPDAAALALIRIEADGSLVPVRGGNPVAVPGVTRRNFCQNPSFEAGLNGTAPDLGTPTLTNPVDGTAPRGAAYLKATIAAAGSCGVVVPNAVTPGLDLTIGFDLQLSAAATSVTVTANWLDSSGTPLTASSTALSVNDINRSVSVFGRQVVQMTTPAAGVTATVKIVAAGLPTGGSMALDGVTIERGTTDGSYFDGATYGATWLGTADLSASVLAPMVTLDDGECPVDVPVRYKLVNTSSTGGAMTSDYATLVSGDRVWLTHPSSPGQPLEIRVEKRPTRGKNANQTVFQAIGDPKFITVASRRRSAWRSSESIALWTFGADQAEFLLDLLDDNQPVLLRAPLSLNYGPAMWLSLGDLEEDPDGSSPWQEMLKYTAPWFQVDAPAV
jgi:hypothetical protein